MTRMVTGPSRTIIEAAQPSICRDSAIPGRPVRGIDSLPDILKLIENNAPTQCRHRQLMDANKKRQ
jgi:hypothetical protein